MKLFVNGCSHSSGAEILEQWHPGCPEKAYGGHLKNLLGCNEYVNIAGPGFSNQWIYHTTVTWLETINDYSDWFVVIGWSGASRIPIYDYEKNQVVHLCPSHHNLNMYSKSVQNAYEHLYKTMLPPGACLELEHSRILGMQMILKNLGIKYVFFDSIWPNHDVSPTKLIDTNSYFMFNEKETYWTKYKNEVWDKSERWANHAPEDYHKSWANKLFNFITDQELIS